MADKRVCKCGCGKELPEKYGERKVYIWGHTPKGSKSNGHAEPEDEISASPTVSIVLNEQAVNRIFLALELRTKAQLLSSLH